MIEGLYEGEHGTDGARLRLQGYAAMLAGAAGHFFGNNPIWHFSGPGLYPTEHGWRDALDSEGAQSMSHLRAVFESLPWWLLSPSRSIRGLEIQGTAYLASTADGSYGIGYVPDVAEQAFRLEADGLSGKIQWIDPSSGREYPPVALEPRAKTGISPPAVTNAGGQADWVFVVHSGK
jgi:hypothetical protein